jgi:hypothetical protein
MILFFLLSCPTILGLYRVAYQRYICKSWGTLVSDHRVHIEGQYYLAPLNRKLEPCREVAGLSSGLRQVDLVTFLALVSLVL